MLSVCLDCLRKSIDRYGFATAASEEWNGLPFNVRSEEAMFKPPLLTHPSCRAITFSQFLDCSFLYSSALEDPHQFCTIQTFLLLLHVFIIITRNLT